jgi:hypothetical protein
VVARCRLSLVLGALGVLVVLGSAAPAIAQQGRANPYGSLFKPRELREVTRLQTAATSPLAACGRTTVPANPRTDPKVAKDPSVTHYTMRVLPPGCR